MRADLRFAVVLACFALSGLAGLIYQTAWLQQFALVFGTSELALVTVLAAYMAGLALGATLAGRWAERVPRPVLAYAVLELGIGLAALLVPAMIGLASRLQVALLGGAELPPEAGSPALALFYLVSSFAILLVPTALMGATLPLLAVDLFHAKEHLSEVGRAIYGASSELANAWTRKRYDELEAGDLDALLTVLRTCTTSCEEAKKAVLYFERNRHRMRYAHFRALGLCTSTGVVEAGCKVVVAHRLKRAGMQHPRPRATPAPARQCPQLTPNPPRAQLGSTLS